MRSNQQFIDKLSNELSRGNHNLHDTAEKLTKNRHLNTEKKFAEEAPRTAKAGGARQFRFNLNKAKGQARSNADVLSVEQNKSYRLWQAQHDDTQNDDDFHSNQSLDHNTAMSQGPSHQVKGSKNLLRAHEVSAPPPIETTSYLVANIDFEEHGQGCSCLGAIKLKIEQELDGLKGEFRKKER